MKNSILFNGTQFCSLLKISLQLGMKQEFEDLTKAKRKGNFQVVKSLLRKQT